MGAKPVKDAEKPDKASLALGIIKAINDDRRISRRSTEVVLCMTLEGREYVTLNWSLTGVMLRDVPLAYGDGQLVPFMLYALGNRDIYFTGIGRIVRYDSTHKLLAVKFDALGAGLSSWLADRL